MAVIKIGEFGDAVIIGTTGRFFETELSPTDEIRVPMWDIHKISVQQRGAGLVDTYATMFKDPAPGDWYLLKDVDIGAISEGVISEHTDAQFMYLKFVSDAAVTLAISLRKKMINTK